MKKNICYLKPKLSSDESFCLVTKLCLTLAVPWIVTHQTPLSTGFFRQEYWSGLPSSLGDLPDPGIKPTSAALAGELITTELPGKPSRESTLPNEGCFSCPEHLTDYSYIKKFCS